MCRSDWGVPISWAFGQSDRFISGRRAKELGLSEGICGWMLVFVCALSKFWMKKLDQRGIPFDPSCRSVNPPPTDVWGDWNQFLESVDPKVGFCLALKSVPSLTKEHVSTRETVSTFEQNDCLTEASTVLVSTRFYSPQEEETKLFSSGWKTTLAIRVQAKHLPLFAGHSGGSRCLQLRPFG